MIDSKAEWSQWYSWKNSFKPMGVPDNRRVQVRNIDGDTLGLKNWNLRARDVEWSEIDLYRYIVDDGLSEPAVTEAEEEERQRKAEQQPAWAESVPEGVQVHDSVNKPKHYQLREGYEVYDLRQDLAAKAETLSVPHSEFSDWDRALEYLIRMWDKNMLEDAKKSLWYINKLIEKLEERERHGEL